MSANASLNGTSFSSDSHSLPEQPGEQTTSSALLFCWTLVLACTALLGSLFSLVSLLRVQTKTCLSALVATLAVDDLLSVLPVAVFLLAQRSGAGLPRPLCTASALLYLFQGVSSNLKGSLIVSYNFYSSGRGREAEIGGGSGRRGSALRAAASVWIFSLLLSVLPLCGWGSYIPTSWGCFTDCASSYVWCLFAVYSLCFCLLAALAAPLSYRLLCSEEQQLSPAAYREISEGYPAPGSPAGCSAATPCLSAPEPVEQRLKQLPSPGWEAGRGGGAESGAPEPRGVGGAQSRSFTVAFAQRRFSLILSWTKVLLWLPMMIQMVVQHITGFQSLSLETLSFLLTLLAATVTPVFILSEHWIHLPCGCIINCRRNSYAVSSEELKSKRRGFEFSLSFQQGAGIYRMAPEKPGLGGVHAQSPRSHGTAGSTRGTAGITQGTAASAWGTTGISQGTTGISQGSTAPGRRLSHGESLGPAPADWEWSRSTSQRTPRQKPGGAFAVPLCAFQGTVSLQAPTGKTLSLSTYEVSAEGQRIAPGSKKVEVCRSKSLGHEPDPEESPNAFADTSVKIHLEVLEICDNEEALDTVSIVSNISQSSAQLRSPSLRYSRKENRFVSCDLGETASYSLFIPSHNPDGDVSISIPATVEAHRLNSQKQHLEGGGYQEEIQLLNKAYRRREEDGGGS